MVRAYILVECQRGQIAAATEALNRLNSVVQADATLGPYDVVVLAKKPDMEAMVDFVTDEVQLIPGVARTTTCLSVKLG